MPHSTSMKLGPQLDNFTLCGDNILSSLKTKGLNEVPDDVVWINKPFNGLAVFGNYLSNYF